MIDEDLFQCKYCTDLCYLSMIKCSVHTSSPFNSQIDRPSAEGKYKRSYRKQQLSKQEKRAKALEEASESSQYCIHHLDYCECPATNYTLVYRYSTAELNQMLDSISKQCENTDSSVQEVNEQECPVLKCIP